MTARKTPTRAAKAPEAPELSGPEQASTDPLSVDAEPTGPEAPPEPEAQPEETQDAPGPQPEAPEEPSEPAGMSVPTRLGWHAYEALRADRPELEYLFTTTPAAVHPGHLVLFPDGDRTGWPTVKQVHEQVDAALREDHDLFDAAERQVHSGRPIRQNAGMLA